MIQRSGVVSNYETTKYDESIWDSFKKQSRIVFKNRINCVAVNYNLPQKFAVPTGRSIIIYNALKDAKYRRIGGFSKAVTSVNFHPDGKLVIGGEKDGFLRLCTTDRNTYHLRKFQAHKGDVIHSNFLRDGRKAITLGVDGLAKIWDVALGELHSKFQISQGNEPPSCMAVGKVNENLFCTGNFSNTVALYDARQPKPIREFSLPSTPSALHFACGDNIIVSAANQYVYTWEASTGKPFFQSGLDISDASTHPGCFMHYKLVTGLAVVHLPLIHQDPLLLSVGMDRLLRITNLNTLEVFHHERLVSPCTAVGAFSDLSHVIVGTESGIIRTFSFTVPFQLLNQEVNVKGGVKIASDEPFAVVEPELKEMASRFSGKWRGINLENEDKALTTEEWFRKPDAVGTRIAPKDWGFQGSKAPLIHEHTAIYRVPVTGRAIWGDRESMAITRLTNSLLRFQHSRALTDSLLIGRRARADSAHSSIAAAVVAAAPLAVVAVVRELSRRGALAAAVSGQTEDEIARLLRFIFRNVWHPRTTPTCLHLFKIVSKVYSPTLLAENKEYVKICRLIRHMWVNSESIGSLSAKLRPFLYPEEVPATSSPTENAELANSDALPSKRQKPDGKIVNEAKIVEVAIKQRSPNAKKNVEMKIPLEKKSLVKVKLNLSKEVTEDKQLKEVEVEQTTPKNASKRRNRRLSKAEMEEEESPEITTPSKKTTSSKRRRT